MIPKLGVLTEVPFGLSWILSCFSTQANDLTYGAPVSVTGQDALQGFQETLVGKSQHQYSEIGGKLQKVTILLRNSSCFLLAVGGNEIMLNCRLMREPILQASFPIINWAFTGCIFEHAKKPYFSWNRGSMYGERFRRVLKIQVKLHKLLTLMFMAFGLTALPPHTHGLQFSSTRLLREKKN